MLDTLAAAYAANKQFSKAIETVDKAIELGTGTEGKSWIREVKKRKLLYEDNKVYFEKAKITKVYMDLDSNSVLPIPDDIRSLWESIL